MDAHPHPAGNVWARRAAAAERNWWDVLNDRKPGPEELAAATQHGAKSGQSAGVSKNGASCSGDSTAKAPQAARLPQCACLQCGELIPTPKTCGSCKLAAYCSRECQQRDWQRHKPQCAKLQAAEKERLAKGLPRPPPPTPDPPLELPAEQLIFSRDGYATLLEAHRRGRAAAAASASAAGHALPPAAGVTPAPADCSSGGNSSGSNSSGSGRLSAHPISDDEGDSGASPDGGRKGTVAAAAGRADVSGGDGDGGSPSSSSSSAAASADSDPHPQTTSSSASPTSSSDAFAGAVGGDGSGGGAAAAAESPLLGCPDGSWSWAWEAPAAPRLLTPARPVGILNSGNSCYAASAIQVLLATPGLGEWLRSGAHLPGCGAPEPGHVSGISSWCPACELSQLAVNAARADALAAAAASQAATAAASVDSAAAESTSADGGNGSSALAGEPAGPAQCEPDQQCQPSQQQQQPPSAWGRAAAVGAAVMAAAAGLVPGGGGGGGSAGAPGAAVPCVDARGLTRQVQRLGRTLVPGRQEDAHELLSKLLEALGEVALAEAGGRMALRARANAAAAAAATATVTANGTGPKAAGSTPSPPPPRWRGDESSLVHHVLGGYLRRATLCDVCGYASQSHESLLGLELTLGPSTRSVEGALGGYFADEVLDAGNEYRCERCRQLVCARRVVRLEAAPNVLALTLKRFVNGPGGQARKNTNPISFRTSLDLSKYMAAQSLDQGPVSYRLYGVIRHLGLLPPGMSSMARAGSLNMGHYVALVRGGDGAWYCCDDDEVAQVTEAEVASCTDAYMLFYARDEPRLPPPPVAATEAEAEAGESEEGEGQREEQAAELATEAAAEEEEDGKGEADAAQPTSPEWAPWIAPDTEPPAPAAAITTRGAVRPQFQLRPPAAGAVASAGASAAPWTLVIALPGVKSARDIKMAFTSPPPPAAPSRRPISDDSAAAAAAAQGGSGRLRVWVAGSFSLDLQLSAAAASSSVGGGDGCEQGLQLICDAGDGGGSGGGGGDGAAAAVAAAVEVLGPRWRPRSATLRVPLLLRPRGG